jgi:hypothetical protein
LLPYHIYCFWSKELKNQSSKNSIRSELRRKTEEYIALGGEIKQHQAGETGEPADKPRGRSAFVSGEPPKTRTYINDVVFALDSRKKKKVSPKASATTKGAKRKVIYDDFGEPIREVWTKD